MKIICICICLLLAQIGLSQKRLYDSVNFYQIMCRDIKGYKIISKDTVVFNGVFKFVGKKNDCLDFNQLVRKSHISSICKIIFASTTSFHIQRLDEHYYIPVLKGLRHPRIGKKMTFTALRICLNMNKIKKYFFFILSYENE